MLPKISVCVIAASKSHEFLLKVRRLFIFFQQRHKGFDFDDKSMFSNEVVDQSELSWVRSVLTPSADTATSFSCDTVYCMFLFCTKTTYLKQPEKWTHLTFMTKKSQFSVINTVNSQLQTHTTIPTIQKHCNAQEHIDVWRHQLLQLYCSVSK